MKKISLFIIVAAAFAGCGPELSDPGFSSGNLDANRYLTMNATMGSGFQDFELYVTAETNSYGAIMARQLESVGRGEFNTHYMVDDVGFGKRRELGTSVDCNGDSSLAPVLMGTPVNSQNFNSPQDSAVIHQIGIPGLRVADMFNSNLDQANPYYGRMQYSGIEKPLDFIIQAKASLFTLWFTDDVLNYSLAGGTGSSLTAEADFEANLDSVLNRLTITATGGALATIPDFMNYPYFNLIPGDALVLTQDQADMLNLLYILNPEVSFQEGPNYFVIQDGNTQRHMTSEERLMLSLNLDSVKCEQYGSATPFADVDVLTEAEISEIQDRRIALNNIIRAKADEYKLAVVEMDELMLTLFNEGIQTDGISISADFVTGGFFSLDGLNPSQRGHALIANEFIEALNTKYQAKIPLANPVNFPSVFLPN